MTRTATHEIAPVDPRDDMYAREGEYFDYDPTSWRVFEHGDARVIASDTGKLLCHVVRNAIPKALCDLGVECFMDAGRVVSTNRGTAAGMSHRTRSEKGNYERGMPSNSGIVGYMDSLRHDRPCRLTAFSRKYFDTYTRGVEFIRAINACFARTVPDAHAAQLTQASKTEFRIADTAFSTVTVNLDFRTALHRDSGDFPGGFGNLVVCSYNIEGGHLLFPRYRVAIKVRTGDYLAMNVHEWHCNSPITKSTPDAYRLSFVCYLRARMHKCEEVNRRIREQGAMDAASICRRIFELAQEPLPEKREIGVGPQGIPWWEYDGQRVKILYRNKTYTLFDKTRGIKIANLWPALEYMREHGESG